MILAVGESTEGVRVPTGRPTIRTDAIVDEIIDRVSSGEPLAQVCRDEHTPSLRTVYNWIEDDGELSARFAGARIAGFDMIAEEALRIANTPLEGVVVKETDKGVETRREDMLGHRKLQVETRLKLLAKWDPKRYGDSSNVKLSGDSDSPIQTQNTHIEVDLTPEQSAEFARLAREALQRGAGK